MKPNYYWIIIVLSYCLFSHAQKRTVFENSELSQVLPEIEAFYNVTFSYTDDIVANKPVSVILDDIVPIKSLLLTLAAQTTLKFSSISENYVVISKYKSSDTVKICGTLFLHDKPLENATIKVNHSIYSSDASGYFLIEDVPFDSKITIFSIGIEKKEITPKEQLYPNCKVISLKEKLELLDQVVINEYIASGISKNIKRTTINRDKLKILPGIMDPDVLESIHQLPGVTNLNETVNSIHVRGGNSDQNLILWNNIKTYNNSHLFGVISAFNPYVIDKVHFTNKGTSARYGERISSVIDMQTNYKPSNKLSGGAGFNMLHSDAFVDIPLINDKLSVMVSGRRSYADLVKTFTFKNYEKRVFQNTKIFDNTREFSRSKNVFWFNDYTVNAAWKVSKNGFLKFNHLFNENHLNFSALNSDESQLFIDELDTKNVGYNLEWNNQWNPNLSHQLDTYFSRYTLNYSFSNTSILGTSGNSKDNKIKDYGVNFNLKYELDTYKQLNFGYQYTLKNFSHQFNQQNPFATFILDRVSNIDNAHAIYTEFQINRPKDHLFNAGLRVNKYSNSSKVLVEPRVILQKFVTPEFSINASVEYKSQFLSQIQESVISNLTLENYTWALSNDTNLPVLTTYQYTIGGNYSKNKWVIDVEAYFKKTKGISTMNLNFNNPLLSFNFESGNTSIQGVDFFVKKQFKNYNSWFSYSFNDAKYTFPGLNNARPFPSNLNIDHTIKWSHFYKWKNVEFSLGWLWHNGKPYTQLQATLNPDNSISYDYTALNNKNLPVYHRLDFSAVYDFYPHKKKTIKYRLGVSVLNLYNRKNILNRDIRSTNDGTTNLINIDAQATTITPNLVLRIFW